MKKLLTLLALLWFLPGKAQLTMPADGGSPRGKAGERIGITDVTIEYGRPGVKGREGHIWGELVNPGFTDDATFGKARKIPWRAGANENTTIEFSTDVLVQGKKLAAGKYGFFIAYDPNECTLIFSKNTEAWGAYFYDQEDDVLRVKAKPVAVAESRERLSYEFSGQTDSSAVVSLIWEKLSIPFTVSVRLHSMLMTSIYKELNSTKSFNPNAYVEAANYLDQHNVNLEDALKFVSTAANSAPTFYVQSRKADIQKKLGREKEAEETMKRAMTSTTSASQLHYYARRLLSEKQNDKAFEVFRQNYDRFPDVYTTNIGMARGYSAIGKYKEALKYAKKALPQSPDASNRQSTEKIIRLLEEGKDINS